MWACGVVMASVLLGRYPLLQAGDDLAALAELTVLLGSRPLQDAARRLGTYPPFRTTRTLPTLVAINISIYLTGRHVSTSRVWRGVCLRRLCSVVRSPAPTPTTSTPGIDLRCLHCGRPRDYCVCRGHTQLVSISIRFLIGSIVLASITRVR